MPGAANQVVARLAPALASVAGFVDAVGFVTLHGLFVAHMSGDSVEPRNGAGGTDFTGKRWFVLR